VHWAAGRRVVLIGARDLRIGDGDGMTQVFADDDQLGGAGMLTPGKGVRPIRCVGCSRDTLPRQGDGAPLCQRCSELLATAEVGTSAAMAAGNWPIGALTPRWLRRRLPLDQP
jgi:hypothetical protein